MLLKNILKKNILSGVLFFMFLITASGSPYFKMNEQCLRAQSLIYSLRIAEAKEILLNESKASPDNIAIPWLQEYCIFIPLFISENEKDYIAQQTEWKNCIITAEKMQMNDPWYRFILSDMYLHRASVKLKMEANISAGNDIKKANGLLKENEARFPEFLPDNKNIGLINVLFSAVPANYKWLTNLLGFEGNLQEGMAKIETYLNSAPSDNEHKWLKVEAAFIHSLLQYHFLKDETTAWKTIDKYTSDYRTNLLTNYMRATIAGYAGRNDEVIQILNQRPVNNKLQPFYYMDYLLGLAKLRRLDADAEQYFKIFTVKFKGVHYIKSAYRYLAWCSIIKGDMQTANTYYSLCRKNGKAFQEEDKQSEKEATETLRWTAEVLRGRLLFDGHYYTLSLKQINAIDEKKITDKRIQLELMYRKARIYLENKDFPNAIIRFDRVISEGKNETYYYAAYSALYLANIYEQLKNNESAIYYFRKAKNDFSRNEEYRNSIEQKAKIGLKRLEK